MLLITSFQGARKSTKLVIGDAKLDHLLKVVPARFLHCEVTLLPFPHSESELPSPAHTQGEEN